MDRIAQIEPRPPVDTQDRAAQQLQQQNAVRSEDRISALEAALASQKAVNAEIAAWIDATPSPGPALKRVRDAIKVQA